MYTDATKKKPSDACDVFLDPVNYIDILEKFPELKICLAHFGGEEEMVMVFDDKGNRKQQQDVLTNVDFLVNNGLPDSTSWFRIVEYLLLHPRYKNVYTDVSFTLHENKLYKALGKLILSSPYKERILFGTDYFMTTQYKSEFNLYDEFRTAVDNKDIWRRVSFENPVSYLESAFYTPPLDSALSTFNQ
jgi:predicted TIM-barrel fold metal-dependent hydrolase